MFPALKTAVGVKVKNAIHGRLIGRIHAVNIIGLSETEFAKLIHEVESDPLFKRFFLPGGDLPRVIRRHPWSATRFFQGFYKQEGMLAGSASADVETILKKHQGLVQFITKMGRENFERYFLYGEEIHSFEEIAERTGLSIQDVSRIHELMLDVSVHAQFAQSGSMVSSGGLHYTKIAYIERDVGDSGFYFSFTWPHLARGRYLVNHEALEEWLRRGALSVSEKKRMRKLLKILDLINIRQNTLWRILEEICRSQKFYLNDAERSKLRPISMRVLSRQLGLAPSTISRAVALRSVVLPWGEEIPLAKLLPGRRAVLTAILEEMFQSMANAKVPDRALAALIEARFGITAARRTINEIRRQIEAKQ